MQSGKGGVPKLFRSRALGAGRKNAFQPSLTQLKHWLSAERSHGHSVTKQDLLSAFLDFLSQEIRAREEALSTETDFSRTQQLEKELKPLRERRLELTEGSTEKYRENYKTKLVNWISARNLRPHLTTKISPLEEEVRTRLTW